MPIREWHARHGLGHDVARAQRTRKGGFRQCRRYVYSPRRRADSDLLAGALVSTGWGRPGNSGCVLTILENDPMRENIFTLFGSDAVMSEQFAETFRSKQLPPEKALLL